MQWLAKLSVKRPVFAMVLILLVCVIGGAGWKQLGVDRFPKVDFPTISVVTMMPGAAPGEMETEVTQKIEEAVNSISGIDQLRSVSTEGVSQVFVQFVLEKDVDVASQEVRDKVSAIQADLPKNIDAPVISKLSSDMTPVVLIAVNADRDVREISEVADKSIRRQLETVDGVGQVRLLGATKRQINVALDVNRLRSNNLTSLDVQRAISRENVTTPGGRLESGPVDFTLRIRGRAETPAQIGDIVIVRKGDNAIHVRDVAQVEDGAEDAESLAFVDGKSAVVLSVQKQTGMNTVKTVDSVRSRLVDIRKSLPNGYTIDIVRDESLTIRTSAHAVTEHLLIGGVMAAIVVLLFLGNLRSTVIAALAIPVSIIGTFALMWLEGFTMDTITLLALALSVGIVIDDAIVVLENIVRFIEEKGMKPFPAAVYATKEIGMAVMATTLSLIAVFLPVAFMGGIVGRFLKSFGMTMSFAIGVSLFVSFTLTPMLSARWLKPLRPAARGANGEVKKPILMRFVDKAYLPIERVYMVALKWVMARRWVVVVCCVATLGSCAPLAGRVPKGFLPKSDEARFEVEVKTPEGTSLSATALAGERVARDLRTMPGVQNTVLTIGDNAEKKRNVAKIYVGLVDPEKRPLSQDEMMGEARKIVAKHSHLGEPGAPRPQEIRIKVNEVPMIGGSAADNMPVAYVISGTDLDVLANLSKQSVETLKTIPGTVDVDSTLIAGKPEVNVRIDRDRAADLGVDTSDIANALRLLVGGQAVSSYEEKGEMYDVHIRASSDQRLDEKSLEMVTVPSKTLGTVRILDVVKVERDGGPSQIEHLNRTRQVTVLSNVSPGFADGNIIKAFEQKIPTLKAPAGYRIEATGRTKEQGKAASSFGIAFALSFLFMYLILAAQFESWLHPITILVSLPLTVPFALISLLIFKQSLDIYSSLGILVLFGVVKKNSILQIEHANHLRKTGMPRLEAILQANKDRLRPILMTTVAFVAGMIPLVTSTGIGAGFNRATAGVIVGGQTLSLVLTLLATPVVYSLFDDAREAVAAWSKKRAEKRALKEGITDEDERGELEIADRPSVVA
jgi:hydrophobic/amphiphilic exporter-1 (mainly G- bacteria), HAE1 family